MTHNITLSDSIRLRSTIVGAAYPATPPSNNGIEFGVHVVYGTEIEVLNLPLRKAWVWPIKEVLFDDEG